MTEWKVVDEVWHNEPCDLEADDETAILTLIHPDYPGIVFYANTCIAGPSHAKNYLEEEE